MRSETISEPAGVVAPGPGDGAAVVVGGAGVNPGSSGARVGLTDGPAAGTGGGRLPGATDIVTPEGAEETGAGLGTGGGASFAGAGVGEAVAGVNPWTVDCGAVGGDVMGGTVVLADAEVEATAMLGQR